MRRFFPAAALSAAVLIVLPCAALAVTARPVSPAGGTGVTVNPQPGYANGDARLTWSIEYPDCPGPDSIHSSWIEVREPGFGWSNEQRGGPFLGNGTFTVLATFFPGKTPRRIEWRVGWTCGATADFPGRLGESAPTWFVLQPAGSPATSPAPCTSLAGKSRTRCLAKAKRDGQLERCAAIKAKPARGACAKTARDAYAKAIRKT
jgi:hypothetical protein